MARRIIIVIAFIGFTVVGLVIGYLLLLTHYKKNGDRALFLSGDYKNAIRYYDKLIWWQPFTSGNYYNRGDAYADDGQYENAIKDYEKSLKLGIDDSLQAILRIALNSKRKGDIQMEEQRLLQLLQLSKSENENELWAANYHLGQVEFKKANYRKAIDFYNAAHAASPTALEVYHRANAYSALGLHDSARRDFSTSIQFVKKDFIKKYPNSSIAQCDSCGFPFGSKEYELLTEAGGETFITTLHKYSGDEKIDELNRKLKAAEKTTANKSIGNSRAGGQALMGKSLFSFGSGGGYKSDGGTYLRQNKKIDIGIGGRNTNYPAIANTQSLYATYD